MSRLGRIAAHDERPAGVGRGAVVWVIVLVLLLVGGASIRLDRGSPERGNRLFREGEVGSASEIYRKQVETSGGDRASYNLGTALLRLDPTEAEAHLERAAMGETSEAARRARYNLGYGYLVSAGESVEPDSVRERLDRAVESNRLAIRLSPADYDARWNLAVAQRMLDSLGLRPIEPETEVSAGEDETRIDLTALVRSETGEGASGLEPDSPNPGDVFGERQTPRQGARESWTTQDPGPLAGAAAEQLIGGARDRPEHLIRGLLWSHRPDVPWWQSAPYPGGGW